MISKDWMSAGWKLLVVRGVVGVLFGVVALVWSVETTLALVVLWGIWALVDGVSSIGQAFMPEGRDGRIWLILMGVIALLAAFFAITTPGLAAATLTWFLGIWLIVRAGFESFGAFSSSRQAPRWLLLLGAAVSLVIGILFVANPGSAAVAVTTLLGLLALLWGLVFVVTGVALRRELSGPSGERLASA